GGAYSSSGGGVVPGMALAGTSGASGSAASTFGAVAGTRESTAAPRSARPRRRSPARCAVARGCRLHLAPGSGARFSCARRQFRCRCPMIGLCLRDARLHRRQGGLDLLQLTNRDPPDAGLGPYGILPGLVLLRIPSALVVELGASDNVLGAAGTVHHHLEVADTTSGPAAGLPLGGSPERCRHPGLGGTVTVPCIDLLPLLDGTCALHFVQSGPIALAQAKESGVAALGSQVHPDIRLHAILCVTLSIPVHFRDHALRRLVGEK